jgi:hypothetical protein
VAVSAGVGAIVVLLLFAGLDSLLLVLVGAVGLAVTAAGVWWVLVHTGPVRVLGGALALAAPAAVVVLYVRAGLLWVVLVSLALWVLAVLCGRTALAADGGRRNGAALSLTAAGSVPIGTAKPACEDRSRVPCPATPVPSG